MNVTELVAPPFLPVTLAEVWEHLRMDPEGSPASTPLDTLLERNIRTATAIIQQRTNRSLISRRLCASFPAFPAEGYGLDLPYPPVREIRSVSYYDSTNTLQALSSSAYYKVEDGSKVELRIVSGYAVTAFARPDAVKVVYEAGFEPAGGSPETQGVYAANVPAQLKDAILMQVELLSGNTSPAEKTALRNAIDVACGSSHIPVLS